MLVARLTRNLFSSRVSTCRVVMVLLTLTLVTDPYAGVNTEVCIEKGGSSRRGQRGHRAKITQGLGTLSAGWCRGNWSSR